MQFCKHEFLNSWATEGQNLARGVCANVVLIEENFHRILNLSLNFYNGICRCVFGVFVILVAHVFDEFLDALAKTICVVAEYSMNLVV